MPLIHLATGVVNVPGTVSDNRTVKQSSTATTPSVPAVSQSTAIKPVSILLPSMLLSRPSSHLLDDPLPAVDHRPSAECGYNPVANSLAVTKPEPKSQGTIGCAAVPSIKDGVANYSAIKTEGHSRVALTSDSDGCGGNKTVDEAEKNVDIKSEAEMTSNEGEANQRDDNDFKPSKKRFRRPASMTRPVSCACSDAHVDLLSNVLYNWCVSGY